MNNDHSRSIASATLTGLTCGILIGFAMMHAGCNDRTFEDAHAFMFNLIGSLLFGLIGAITGAALSVLRRP